MSQSKLKSIWSRYSVTIVMIPTLIGLHYGWNSMQYNRSLVSEEEQIELPVVKFAKYCWRSIVGEERKDGALPEVSTTASK